MFRKGRANVSSRAATTTDSPQATPQSRERDGAPPGIEAAIEGARRLLGDALDAARSHQRAGTAQTGPEPIVRLLRRRATTHPVRVLCDSLGELSAVLETDAARLLGDMLADGHSVSVLHHDLPALRGRDADSLTALDQAGAEVRLLPRSLPTMATTASEVILVQGGPATASRVLLLRSPEATQAAQRLHDSLCELAVDFTQLRHTVTGLLQPGPHADVLGLLCSGVKDETAARQLRVSVRTYRRYVAHILRALGAGSRFEAGMRVSELGLADVRRRMLAFAG